MPASSYSSLPSLHRLGRPPTQSPCSKPTTPHPPSNHLHAQPSTLQLLKPLTIRAERVPLLGEALRTPDGSPQDIVSEYGCFSCASLGLALKDEGRRFDVLSSVFCAAVLAFYGVLRLAPRFDLPTGNGAIVSTAAPFFHTATFLVSALYHISLPYARESSVLRELDVGMVQLSIVANVVALTCTAVVGPHGDLPEGTRWQVFSDTPLAAAIAIVVFVGKRCVTPVSESHQLLNDEGSRDARHIHAHHTEWRGLRWGHTLSIAVGWIVQLQLVLRPSGLCHGAAEGPPTVPLILVSFAIFLVGALVDHFGWGRFCAPSLPTTTSHTGWHVIAMIGLLAALVASDLQLAWRRSNACSSAL